DQRSDLFSLGIVLYELITDQNPFARDSGITTAQAIVAYGPQPLNEYSARVPGGLQTVVSKLLEKDPDRRYQSAAAVLHDLSRLTGDMDSDALTRTFHAMQPIRKRRKPWRSWVIAACGLVVVALAAYLVWPDLRGVGSPRDAIFEEGRWQNSIAVLPFRSFGSGEEQEYFSDGITDAIIGKLSGLEGLKVISMTSVMRFKGADRAMKEIGEELQVASILEGSVQKEDGRVRIRAQLIEVDTDAHLWSETYDRELESIFSVQDDISRAIADVLEVKLLGSQGASLAKQSTASFEAYNSYMQGRHLWRKRTEEHLRASITHFENAIALDSNYAQAYAGLADAWAVLPAYSQFSREEATALAKRAALRALELDDEMAEAHASLGLILRYEGRLEESETEFLRAIEINPGYAWAHTWYSSLLNQIGRTEESTRELERAFSLDPLNIVTLSNLADRRRYSGDWEGAISMFERAIEIEPTPNNLINIGEILDGRGRLEEAIAQYRRSVDEFPFFVNAYRRLTRLYARMGETGEAHKVIDDYVSRTGDTLHGLEGRADLFYSMGDFDRAIEFYNQMLGIEQDHVSALSELSHLYLIVGLSDKAIKAADKLVASWPDRAASYGVRGETYQLMGKFERALVEFESAKQLDPDNPYYVRQMVVAFLYSRDYDRANMLAESLLDYDDSFTLSWIGQMFALIHAARGQYERSLALLDSCVAADSGLTSTTGDYKQLQRVFILEESGYLDSALQMLSDVVNSSERRHLGNVLYWQDYLAYLQAKQGDIGAATQTAEGLRARIDSAGRTDLMYGYWLTLGLIELARGSYAEAIDRFLQAGEQIFDPYSSNYIQLRYFLGLAYYESGDLSRAAGEFEALLSSNGSARINSMVWVSRARYYLGVVLSQMGRVDEAREQLSIIAEDFKDADPGLDWVEDARLRLAQLN
ncbi:MAG: tetratricopeptide repeat protein, partial [Candidatus Zixiibacteriota bacterium]